VVREAFGRYGMHGLKLHCHVQKMAADDPRLDEVYALCQDAGKPVLIHAGREPASPAYGVDTRVLCGADQVDRVLRKYPRLVIVVPHLGADEFDAYAALLERHENLWLDTTMAVAGFFPADAPSEMVERHASRLLYGTDFPNLPYAWDRELRRLVARPLDRAARTALFSGNARRGFGF
jgi:predicted TIM-barrel fold metal-dependent hydrolase